MILKTFEKNPRHLSEEDIRELSEKVQPYLTGKRYAHTMAVAEEAARLGAIFGFSEDDRNRLRASALMHDITKLADSKKQLQYCEEFGIIIEPEKNVSASVFHGITGAALAARDFADYADADILSGIRWHTTGRYGMTVFESIIYLADYIEPTRTFDDCLALRQYFYDRIAGCASETERDDILRDTMIYSFDLTIGNLLEDQRIIDSDTICARNYFIALALQE
jgi:nicotinate-nucleotide adenylyltransferase